MDPNDLQTYLKISLEVHHLYGQKLLERFHAGKKLGWTPIQTGGPGSEAPPKKLPEMKAETPVHKVAIIGGGVAGLYTAMLLKEGNHEFDVDIFEANQRIGGRLYTHRFDKKSDINTPAQSGEYDYFDVGAMRFPDTPVMKKTFELFDKLGIERLPYHLSKDETWLAFNGVRKRRGDIRSTPGIWQQDPFKVGVLSGGNVPEEFAAMDPSKILKKELERFIELLLKNPSTGLDTLIDNYDHFSTRSYLSSKKYPPSVINWIETMSVGTGWFDRGLIETILEELAFSYPTPWEVEWQCVKGGSEMIPMKMMQWLKKNCDRTKIHTQHRVTAVVYKDRKLTVSGICHPLKTGDPSFFKQTYDQVIFAIPPPCLRMIDLDTCELDYLQTGALRQLQLAPSCKIGMKFKSAWWTKDGQNILGGQSSTDRTARTIVYPSHGAGESTVLIASYAWTQDSSMLGTMMHGPGSAEEERLKQIMLEDLAYVHDIPLADLVNEFEYMYAFDWGSNPLSMGAFGLFGPSQFREFYRAVTRPAAQGQLHFVGETFSTTHGWVAGALDSAARGVLQVLQHHKEATNGKEDLIGDFKKDWNPDLEVTEEVLWRQRLASFELQRKQFRERK